MIKLDKYEQQVILACKNWGKWGKEDRFKAVKVVVAQYYALDLDDTPLYSMYHCLLNLFIKINKDRELLLQDFLLDIFHQDWCGGYVDKIDMEHLVRKLIIQISNEPARDISIKNGNVVRNYFEELEPDYEILDKWYGERVI